jgi:GDP-L-fucose synthase
MDWKKRILVTGANGMVGHALIKELRRIDATDIIAVTREKCDLTKSEQVKQMMYSEIPDYVFHLAGSVFGIGGNTKYPADILHQNAMININVIEYSRKIGVKKIVVMGSGCIYPEINNGQDLSEDQIWLGEPHASEGAYAHAKRLMLAQLMANKKQYDMNYAYAISGNLYGENDKFDIENGHIIPSLIRKFYEASINQTPVNVWGTGVAVRDFTYSTDTAKTLILLMEKGEGAINIGSGQVHKIKDIVDVLQKLTGLDVEWDSSKPDGQFIRYYNLDKLKALGFTPSVTLQQGIELVYNWYKNHAEAV